jgi:hypothetical protein
MWSLIADHAEQIADQHIELCVETASVDARPGELVKERSRQHVVELEPAPLSVAVTREDRVGELTVLRNSRDPGDALTIDAEFKRVDPAEQA